MPRPPQSRRWTDHQIVQSLQEAYGQFKETAEKFNAAVIECDVPGPDHQQMERLEDARARLSADLTDYEEMVRRAINAGLMEHPLVRARIDAHRSLGHKDELRSLRLGIEGEMDRGIDLADLWIGYEAADLVEKRKSLEETRRALLARLNDPLREAWRTLIPEDPGIRTGVQKEIRKRLGTARNLRKRLTALNFDLSPERSRRTWFLMW